MYGQGALSLPGFIQSLVDGEQEWVMFMACRVTMWDTMWDSTKQSPPTMEAMGIWINSDWAFWDSACSRFIDEGRAEEPADEDKDCFVSRIYFLPNYDTFMGLRDVPPEDQEKILAEDAVLLWQKE